LWRPQGATSRDSENLVVAPNTYLPFQVQFFEQFGAASLRLEWSINGGAYTVVPREAFFINKDICNYQFNFDYVSQMNSKAESVTPQNHNIEKILNQNWVLIPSSCCVIGITQLNNGSLLGIGTDKQLYSRNTLYDNWSGTIQSSCCVIGITQLKDGTILGIGTDKQLWSKKSLDHNWSGPIRSSCCVIGITQLNDESIVGIGTDYQLWTKKSLLDNWQGPIVSSCCVIGITQLTDGSLLGIGLDNKLWRKKTLTDNWQGPISNTCCIIGITQLKDGSLLGIGTDKQLYIKSNLCESQLAKHKQGKILYGSWIRNPVSVQYESQTHLGEKVYLTYDDVYTKMVSQTGVGKYYQGPISDYKPCNWNNYSIAPNGAYLIRSR